eukprot:1305082-Prymnesium_polylepis.1
MLSAGAVEVDALFGPSQTPLYLAAQEGHALCLRLLVDAKANVDAAADDGTSPMFIAAQKGHAPCLQLLIDAKAN